MPKQINQFPRSVPKNNDYLVFQTASSGLTKSCLVSELPFTSPSNLVGASPWIIANDSYLASCGDKVIFTASNKTLTLPTTPDQKDIEIYNYTDTGVITINLNGAKFQGVTYSNSYITLKPGSYGRIVYLNSNVGWMQLGTSNLTLPMFYPSGMSLWLEGSLINKSGSNRNATPIGANSPTIVTGLDGKPVLRWNGTSNQELQVNPFLAGTSGATLYIVFSVRANTHYNLIRTANVGDFWRFTVDGNGYMGTFLSRRVDGYPNSMPSTGNHLVSIHANTNTYEVILNNISKGILSLSYNPGDRFCIVSNDFPFNGDIALLLVYPNWIDKTSTQHQQIIGAIKSNYPSLLI